MKELKKSARGAAPRLLHPKPAHGRPTARGADRCHRKAPPPIGNHSDRVPRRNLHHAPIRTGAAPASSYRARAEIPRWRIVMGAQESVRIPEDQGQQVFAGNLPKVPPLQPAHGRPTVVAPIAAMKGFVSSSNHGNDRAPRRYSVRPKPRCGAKTGTVDG